MDPRVGYSRSDLQSSLDLQLKISAALTRNFNAYQQVKDLRARLAELKKRNETDPIAKPAAALDSKLGALEGEATPILEEPKNASFSAVNDSLTALMALVDGADFAPSEESFAAYQRVCTGLNATLASWQDIKTKELPSFGTLLSRSNLQPLGEYPTITEVEGCSK
jgi:hypothetical protein